MTIHISAKKDEIADFVLMPGDPLRAKTMAQKFLKNPRLVNEIRGMSMYSGTYKGMPITIAASGMGNGSMGIYSYELFHDYGVKNIVRVGTAGAYRPDYPTYALFNTLESFSESPYAKIVTGIDTQVLPASTLLVQAIEETAKALKIPLFSGRAHSSDVFYRDDDQLALAQKNHLDVVEMESFALFSNAQKLHKNAAAIFTISDNLVTGNQTTPHERQEKFTEMFHLVLEAAHRLYHSQTSN